MKRVLIFVLTLLALSPEAFAYVKNQQVGTYCPNITNNWSFLNSNGGTGIANFILTQNSSATGSAITGTVTNFWCLGDRAYETLTVDSSQSYSLGNGQFAFYARNSVSGCTINTTLTIPMSAAGCQYATDEYSNPYTGKQCYIPAGEVAGTTGFIEWLSTNPGVAQFATRFDMNGSTGYSFAGRESFTDYSTKTGSCVPLLSLNPSGFAIQTVTDGQYISGQYDVDEQGYSDTNSINTIRAQTHTFPCTVSYTETENMDCVDSTGAGYWAPYQNNIQILYTISNNPPTLTVQRANAAETELFGLSSLNNVVQKLIDIVWMNPLIK